MRSLKRCVTCAGSDGAAMVTTALASGIWPAAARIAAPPRLWPIRIAGALRVSRRWSAARTRSATLEENVELAKSPSLEPRPVKSNRSTAMPLRRKRDRDALRRQHILAAGEAMRKQRIGVDCAVRRIQRGGKLMAAFAGELKAFGRHRAVSLGQCCFSRRNSVVRPRDRRGCDSRGLPNSPARPASKNSIACSHFALFQK